MQSVAMSESIVCATHGPRAAVLVCSHLLKSDAPDLFLVPADDEEGAQAWCAICENARLADGGWYDKADAVAKWEIVCSTCYQLVADGARSLTVYEGVTTPDDE